ncbi:MAG: alpha/beta hydrolase [Thermoguttaceae bacterium]
MIDRSEHLTMRSQSGKKAFAPFSFQIESSLFASGAPDESRAFFAPLHYEPNYAYPLLVWLHGPNSDEWQLMRIMPHVSMRNYVAVAPRGLRVGPREDQQEIWGWPQELESIQAAESRVFECIEAARRKLHVAPDRIFLAGFDCGGTMAFRVAANHPMAFAGVISLGGAFPSGQTPFCQWLHARRLAVLLAVGRDSLRYPPVRACQDLRLLHAAGISVTLKQYPWADLLTAQVLGDVNRWVMQQIATPRQPCCQPEKQGEIAP